MLVKWRPLSSIIPGESLFEDFFNSDFPALVTRFEPRIDIKETDKEFMIVAELPGMEKDDFKLTIEDNMLVLEGEKKVEAEDKDTNYYRSERSYGSFRRSFRLNDTVDSKKIDANYKNGVLTITIPKTEKSKPKQIAIH